MNINEFTTLNLTFKGEDIDDLEVLNTHFKKFELVEQVFSLPLVNITLAVIDSKSYTAIDKAEYIDIALSTDNQETIDKFTVQIISQNQPEIGRTRLLEIRGLFYIPEFNKDRKTEVYSEMTPKEVLDSINSIEVDSDEFNSPDTFYQFNTNDWDFINNNLSKFTKPKKDGVPLFGISANSILIVRDTSVTNPPREPDHRVATEGKKGVYEYSGIAKDTVFSTEYFIYERLNSFVKSRYDSTEYLPISEENPIIDAPLLFDNGNCSEDHTQVPLVNVRNYLNTSTVKVHFSNNYNNIKLLDYIELSASEESLSGLLYVTKVVTIVEKGISKTIHLKGL